jgi:hypothetical protein
VLLLLLLALRPANHHRRRAKRIRIRAGRRDSQRLLGRSRSEFRSPQLARMNRSYELLAISASESTGLFQSLLLAVQVSFRLYWMQRLTIKNS